MKKAEPEWSSELLVLFWLMFAGIILRIYNLGFNSLWLDEAATYSLSAVSIPQIFQNTATGEFNPPLFFIIEHFMLMIGNNEWSLRFMPALFGIACIPAIYLAGKEFRDKYVGLIAAAAFTFSPFLLVYSQEARAYSLLLLLCIGMLYYFLIAMRTDEIKYWMFFAVIAGIAFWTHFYSLVFFIALFSYALIKKRAQIKLLIYSFLAWLIITLPLFVALGYLIQLRTKTAPTYGIQGFGIIVETFKQIFGYADILTVIMFCLLAGGLLWAYFNAYEQGALVCWTIAIAIGVSFFASFIIPMLPRYLIFLAIPIYLGIGLSYRPFLNWISYHTKPAYAVLWYIVFFMMMAVPFYSTYYTTYTKEDWRGISQDITDMTNEGDIVIAVPNYITLPLGYYYNSTADRTAFNGLSTAEGLEIAKQTIPNTTYYVVTADISAVDPHGKVIGWMAENTHIVVQYDTTIIARRLADNG